jgi:hypothetical protein
MKEIKQVSFLKLPIKESIIRERSEKDYNEPDPCIIYTATIINKMGLEFCESMKDKVFIGALYNIKELSILFDESLDFPLGTTYGKII